MKTRMFAAIVQKDEGDWTALCPDVDVASQGKTIEHAMANLREAVELFFEVANPLEVERRLRSEIYLSQLEVQVG
jgi:predicted RNase H-like HicB family nuclease